MLDQGLQDAVHRGAGQAGGRGDVGEVGAEGLLFRRVLGCSVAMPVMLCTIVWLQSTAVLGWMVVR